MILVFCVFKRSLSLCLPSFIDAAFYYLAIRPFPQMNISFSFLVFLHIKYLPLCNSYAPHASSMCHCVMHPVCAIVWCIQYVALCDAHDVAYTGYRPRRWAVRSALCPCLAANHAPSSSKQWPTPWSVGGAYCDQWAELNVVSGRSLMWSVGGT